jgi:hypothetical protein
MNHAHAHAIFIHPAKYMFESEFEHELLSNEKLRMRRICSGKDKAFFMELVLDIEVFELVLGSQPIREAWSLKPEASCAEHWSQIINT